MHKITRSANETPAEREYRKLFDKRKSGESLAALATRIGVAPGTLSWWRHELRRRDRARADSRIATPALLPVRVLDPPPPAPARTTSYEVSVANGRRVIRVPAGFDPATVRALVAAVEGASC
jgi:transposase-like protein